MTANNESVLSKSKLKSCVAQNYVYTAEKLGKHFLIIKLLYKLWSIIYDKHYQNKMSVHILTATA